MLRIVRNAESDRMQHQYFYAEITVILLTCIKHWEPLN